MIYSVGLSLSGTCCVHEPWQGVQRIGRCSSGFAAFYASARLHFAKLVLSLPGDRQVGECILASGGPVVVG